MAPPKRIDPSEIKEVLCPFTNEPLKIEMVKGTRSWWAVGKFYRTKPYESRRSLLYDLMTRGGKDPGFDRVASISVRDRVPESDPNAPVADLIEKEKKMDSFVGEFVGKEMRS